MKDKASKTLKKINKRCPDCDSFALFLIAETKKVNGILRTEKYIICRECEYKTLFKEKKNFRKPEFGE